MTTAAMPKPKPTEFKLFEVNPSGDGYEVVCGRTGRPVSRPYDTRTQAQGRAYGLNCAATRGSKALAVALGARD